VDHSCAYRLSLSLERQHTHCAPNRALWARDEAQRGICGFPAQVAPECTVRPAAITGRTRRNCAV